MVVAVSSGWDQVIKLVLRPRVGELLVNTFWLEAITLPVAAVLGVTLAWITERSILPGVALVVGADGGAAGHSGVRPELCVEQRLARSCMGCPARW